ncbi:MAG: preprotein translocase subunit SecA [Bacteroidales bacterium]|jgi:preprotein translocase subunit SecA|nr:preprotein translocase subunit SecA [Bacteroidales bacterium]MCI2121883.1 preprotein translocase subunit SecA [Bacteroidales bacterium]MCI2145655.1 preprotein translocase subunit SecA [Bacteroidales bacterium]
MNIIKSIFGSKEQRDIKALKPILAQVLESYDRIDKLSDDQLREETNRLKKIIRDDKAADEGKLEDLKKQLEDVSLDSETKEKVATESDEVVKKIDEDIEASLNKVLPDAFAIMKSTARRFKENPEIRVKATPFDKDLSTNHDFVSINGETAVWKNRWMAGGNLITWDMVHYDVQLMGGIVLHQGKIAEMATGEGKTLVATLPVFLNALAGKGVHMVTVNDYLSKRDSEWMGPLYMFHGLSVDCIDKYEPNSEDRKRAYKCDVVFGTNNEFGFDYLRDNMAINLNDIVQQKLHYAIVDEVDSVLIDDARTPLIISGPVPHEEDDQQFVEYKPYVEKVYQAQRMMVNGILNEAKKKIAANDIKIEDENSGAALLLRANKGLPKYNPLIKYLSEPGMKQLMQKTESYYMQNNNELMYKITDPLYFVIDEQQNSVELTDKGNDLIAGNLEDPNFFIIPDIGNKLAEIEKKNAPLDEKQKEKDDLLNDYSLKTERVHTIIQLFKAYTMFELNDQYVVMDNKVKIVDEQTGRILEGRRYSDGLHQAIEAKENVKVEAATQTFATITLQNYFRMYHKLAGMTGTASTEAGELWNIYKLDVVVIPTNKPVIRKDEEDLIYKTRREKFNAVIDKVVELTQEGRAVLVGTTSVEVSEQLSRLLKMRGIPHQVLNAKQYAHEADVVAHAGESKTVTIATNMAGRGTDIKLAPSVRDAGGLAIIGTERHDSRRVDRQLRGRAGRQGDPGSSLFFVSLEDDLMRLFGSERIAKVVDSLGMKEGEALQNSMLSSSIERAQRKVEENNFGIRKRLLEYDDVMNSQRTVVYARRRNALYGDRIDVDIRNMVSDFCDSQVDKYGKSPYEDFKFEIMSNMSIEPEFDEDFYKNASPEQISEKLLDDVKEVYKRRNDTMVSEAWPVIKDVYEKQSAIYQNIAIPVSDGKKMMTVSVNLKKAYESEGKELPRTIAKTITLIMIDEYWKQQLRDMDDLKQSVQTASYEQKDPLLVYKLESYNLFEEMMDNINKGVISFLLMSHIPLRQDQQARVHEAQQKHADLSKMQTSHNNSAVGNGKEKSNTPIRVSKKIGRNDPCPCGSGLKYKNCHGKGL